MPPKPAPAFISFDYYVSARNNYSATFLSPPIPSHRGDAAIYFLRRFYTTFPTSLSLSSPHILCYLPSPSLPPLPRLRLAPAPSASLARPGAAPRSLFTPTAPTRSPTTSHLCLHSISTRGRAESGGACPGSQAPAPRHGSVNSLARRDQARVNSYSAAGLARARCHRLDLAMTRRRAEAATAPSLLQLLLALHCGVLFLQCSAASAMGADGECSRLSFFLAPVLFLHNLGSPAAGKHVPISFLSCSPTAIRISRADLLFSPELGLPVLPNAAAQ